MEKNEFANEVLCALILVIMHKKCKTVEQVILILPGCNLLLKLTQVCLIHLFSLINHSFQFVQLVLPDLNATESATHVVRLSDCWQFKHSAPSRNSLGLFCIQPFSSSAHPLHRFLHPFYASDTQNIVQTKLHTAAQLPRQRLQLKREQINIKPKKIQRFKKLKNQKIILISTLVIRRHLCLSLLYNSWKSVTSNAYRVTQQVQQAYLVQ